MNYKEIELTATPVFQLNREKLKELRGKDLPKSRLWLKRQGRSLRR